MAKKRKPGTPPPVPEGRHAKGKRVQDDRAGADLNFGSRNMAVLGAAVVCIVGGFLLLAAGSIVAAPLLLVLGYCVLVPYGLATTQ